MFYVKPIQWCEDLICEVGRVVKVALSLSASINFRRNVRRTRLGMAVLYYPSSICCQSDCELGGGPLLEPTPADTDGCINTNEQKERTFNRQFQVPIIPNIHSYKILSPSFRDIVYHFTHRLEPYFPSSVNLHLLYSIAQRMDIVDGGCARRSFDFSWTEACG